MRWLAAFIILLLPYRAFAGASEDYQEAIRLYDQGNFAAAATKFNAVIDAGYGSAPLYYNAACAYYKAGKLGMAIANFRRAEKLSPDDEDIRTNLAFVRQFAVDKIDNPAADPFLTKVGNSLATLHPNQYFLISFVAFALIFVFLALKRIGVVTRIGYSPAVFLAIVAVLAAVSMGWVLRANYLTEEGVIVAEQTEVLSGPGSDFELQFEGHEGLMFTILDQKEGYYLGLFANKLKGWVQTTAVEPI